MDQATRKKSIVGTCTYMSIRQLMAATVKTVLDWPSERLTNGPDPGSTCGKHI